MNIDNDWLKENVNLDDYINENIKKVLIHIGFHKTATSSIQQTLYKNLDILKQNNINYLENVKAPNAFTLYGLFCDDPTNRYDHHLQRGHSQKQVDEFNQDNLITLLKEIKKCKQAILLFSEEHLSGLVNEQNISELKAFLKRIMPNAEYRIICSVRNSVTYYVSAFQERIIGNTQIIPKEFDYNMFPMKAYFKNRLNGYINVFGIKNMTIYKFEDACKNKNGPVCYFLERILGIKEEYFSKIKVINTNEGKSKKTLEIISYCNEKIPYFVNGKISERREFKDTHPLGKIRGDKFNLPSSIQKQIYNDTYTDIKWLKNTFGIDYTNQKFDKKKEKEEVYGNEYFDDVLYLFPRLNETMKVMVYQFVCEKIDIVKDEGSKKWLQKLKIALNDYIGSEKAHLISVSDNYDWFINSQKNEEFKGIPQIYRDIAIFCELHGEIDTAKTFMGIAKEYAPDGPIINSKYDEYTKLLENKKESKKIYIK